MDVQVVDRTNRRQTQTPAHEAPPCALVIFGAGGDLTKRLVMPAIYNLCVSNLLPKNFVILGVDMAQQDAPTWAKGMHDFLEASLSRGGEGTAANEVINEAAWSHIAKNLSYLQ